MVSEVLHSSEDLKLVFAMTSDLLRSFIAQFEHQSGNMSQLKEFLEAKLATLNQSLHFSL